jgi:hypothetical protein
LVVSGQNGLLARLDDSQAFCAAARSLAGDLPAARAMGERARSAMSRLDWSRIVEAVEAEYVAALTVPGVFPRLALNPLLPSA